MRLLSSESSRRASEPVNKADEYPINELVVLSWCQCLHHRLLNLQLIAQDHPGLLTLNLPLRHHPSITPFRLRHIIPQHQLLFLRQYHKRLLNLKLKRTPNQLHGRQQSTQPPREPILQSPSRIQSFIFKIFFRRTRLSTVLQALRDPSSSL